MKNERETPALRLLSGTLGIEFETSDDTESTGNGVNFCPEAWWLRRHGNATDADAMERLRAGSLVHCQIGRATGRLVTTDFIRHVMLIVTGAGLAAHTHVRHFRFPTPQSQAPRLSRDDGK